MSSLQELCANRVMSDAPGRGALGSPRTYHARIPWQQTTSHPNVAQRYKADINDKAFPRDPHTLECHTYNNASDFGETWSLYILYTVNLCDLWPNRQCCQDETMMFVPAVNDCRFTGDAAARHPAAELYQCPSIAWYPVIRPNCKVIVSQSTTLSFTLQK